MNEKQDGKTTASNSRHTIIAVSSWSSLAVDNVGFSGQLFSVNHTITFHGCNLQLPLELVRNNVNNKHHYHLAPKSPPSIIW